MNNYQKPQAMLVFLSLFAGNPVHVNSQTVTTNSPAPIYHLYAGTTHSHTVYTWSHGVQGVAKSEDGKPSPKKRGLNVTPDGVSHAPKDRVLKSDWQKLQGPPSAHYALAKANGYDFYATTDHSQEEAFHPTGRTNAAWLDTKRDAAEATDSNFIAMPGFEHSENNGPNGTGHISVFNSADYLNALEKGVDLPYLYKWLKTVPSNGDGPVVASFNHPRRYQAIRFPYVCARNKQDQSCHSRRHETSAHLCCTR